MEQSTLRELQLEESLRFAANALKYAAELVRALSYPDTTDADYLRIRYFEALRDLKPCEETERDLREATEGAQANKAKRIEIRNGKEVWKGISK